MQFEESIHTAELLFIFSCFYAKARSLWVKMFENASINIGMYQCRLSKPVSARWWTSRLMSGGLIIWSSDILLTIVTDIFRMWKWWCLYLPYQLLGLNSCVDITFLIPFQSIILQLNLHFSMNQNINFLCQIINMLWRCGWNHCLSIRVEFLCMEGIHWHNKALSMWSYVQYDCGHLKPFFTWSEPLEDLNDQIGDRVF